MVKKIKTHYYMSKKAFYDHDFQKLNIQGYHTFGNGQTVVNLNHAPPKLERIPKEYFSKGGELIFEIHPSLSKISSPTQLFRCIISLKKISGKKSYKDPLSNYDLKNEMMIQEKRVIAAPSYRLWYERIRSQVEVIKADRDNFKKESVKTESIKIIRDGINYIQNKYKWNAADLKEVVDESAREFLVAAAMEN